MRIPHLFKGSPPFLSSPPFLREIFHPPPYSDFWNSPSPPLTKGGGGNYAICYIIMIHGHLYPTGRIGFFQAYTIGGETSKYNAMSSLKIDLTLGT